MKSLFKKISKKNRQRCVKKTLIRYSKFLKGKKKFPRLKNTEPLMQFNQLFFTFLTRLCIPCV